MSGLSVPGALARGLSLRRLRPRARLPPQAAADRRVRGLRQAALAAGRHHLRADQDRPGHVVPRDLPGDLEQGRDLGDGAEAADGLRVSYQTAWSWLHKIRKAMVRPERTPLAARVEADETYVGGPRPGKPGRGAGAARRKVAGAVESGRGQARGRRLGRLRLAVIPDVSARSLEGFLAAAVARPATIATDGWSGYGGLAAAGYTHEPLNLSASWGDAALRLPGDPSGVRAGQALAARHPPRRRLEEASAGLSRRVRVPLVWGYGCQGLNSRHSLSGQFSW